MLNKIVIALMLFGFSGTANAQNLPSKVVHYVATHKELLLSDAITLAGATAEVISSDGCQHYRKYCIETNPILGQHPTQLDTALFVFGTSGLIVGAQHAIWHFAPDNGSRHAIWLITTPLAVSNVFEVKSNAESTQGIRACYRSGICN